MSTTKDNLIERANIIKGETNPNMNSNSRVGSLLENIIDFVESEGQGAKDEAEQAKTAAQQAVTSAQEAVIEAEQAKDAALLAKESATESQSSAQVAAQVAQESKVAAEVALEGAETALQSAEQASMTAQQAAQEAQTAAEEAAANAPIQHITVNGTEVEPDENKTINIETGEGNLKGVILNGVEQEVNSDDKVVMTVDIPDVDQTLDATSSNPIANSAVATKIATIENNTVAGMDAEVSSDETSVTLSLLNGNGDAFASVEIPAGSGSGSGDTDTTTKVVLASSVDNPVIKSGESSKLTYVYDHQYSSGDNKGVSTGQKATILLQIKFGSTTVYSQTIANVAAGTYELDLTNYLQVGTNDVYVKATVNKLDGSGTQTKQSYVSVKSYSLALASSYSITGNLSGYASEATISIPFAVTGAGSKEVFLYLNGIQKDTKSVTKSGTTNGTFSLTATDLNVGRNTVQMVCVLTVGSISISSNSIYFDMLKTGDSAPHIATKQSFEDGRIFDSTTHLTPTLPIGQYEKLEFDFAVYDPSNNPAIMFIYRDGNLSQTVSVNRTLQAYTNRFTLQGNVEMLFKSGITDYPFAVAVSESDIDLMEITDGLALKLDASGRSNTEANPDVWQYGDISVSFAGFDWSSNGWTGTALKLTNGANITIPFKPFATDASSAGKTIEFEFTCSNIIDKEGTVLSCLFNNIGFKVTTQEAFLTSVAASEVSTKFATDMAFKVAFVIQKKSGNRLLQIYVNGILCGCLQYAATDSFIQTTAQGITVTSDNADVLLKNVRIYSRALSDDEELANYIIDREDSDAIVTLFNNNQVLDDESAVSIDKLRAKGKSVMRIIGDVNQVNTTNNKSFEVPVTVYFYSAYGSAYDFVLTNGGLRIQGTSSTGYPRKNYRIYFDRKAKYGTTLTVGGVEQTVLKYSFKPNALPVSLFTIKADFAESSSTHNTGLARLLNDTWKNCGFLTPPQKIDTSVRTGIDGFPMDAFYDNDGTNVNTYLGKYNFNNDKSGSAQIFGFENIAGFNDSATLNGAENMCMCLEFLNNSYALGLFTTDDMSGFANALEFRYPESMTWATATTAKKAAIQRLWSWVKACEGNTAKFASEVASYFDVDSLTAWYIATEYFMMCDQRVKNMMLATWDGLKWYFLPYDCDTILGVRNDGKLVYDYSITEESYDDSILSYCFAGHDSLLWNLVRSGLTSKLQTAAQTIRANMSKTAVLTMFNDTQMGNWSERIYNKDGDYKYIQPLLAGNGDFLYSLQGSRYAHRTYMVNNRFDLLDAKYLAGTYRADNFRIYFGHAFSSDNKTILITASERYYFGYGYTSGTPHQSGVLAETAGAAIALTLDSDLIVNDPQYVYGASKMREIDFTNVSAYIVNNIDFSKCTKLQKLDLACAATQSTLTGLILNACTSLKELNITGLKGALFTSLDLTGNTRLEKLSAGSTALTGVEFAPGAPITSIVLPATLQILKLKGLNKLTNTGLTLEGTSNITKLWIDSCALIDWKTLYASLSNVTNLRITDIDMEGSATFLTSLMSVGGLDDEGSVVSTCSLVGTYKLTSYVEDATYAAYVAHFPELTIKQPEYSVYKRNRLTSDPASFTNLDNNTGYGTGNDYVVSGHIKSILSGIFRFLGKQTSKTTMTYYPLHNENSNYFADATSITDATAAETTGAMGDVFTYFPHFWYKGITDYKNGIDYFLYSKGTTAPGYKGVVTDVTPTLLQENSALTTGKSTIAQALTSSITNYAVYRVSVSGYKSVRFQPNFLNPAYCSYFTDANGNVVEQIQVEAAPTVSSIGFVDGMNYIKAVPTEAVYLYFTFYTNNTTLLGVRLTDGISLFDMEDWVEHKEVSISSYFISMGTNYYVSMSGKTPTSGQPSANDAIVSGLSDRGMYALDYDMYKDIANLAILKYGTHEMTKRTGIFSSLSTTGLSDKIGIRDTIYRSGQNNCFYPVDSSSSTYYTIGSPNVLGLESLYGIRSFFGWLGANMTNNSINLNTGTISSINKTITRKHTRYSNASYIAHWIHGRYMDIDRAYSSITGSSSTYVCAEQATSYGEFNEMAFGNNTLGGLFSSWSQQCRWRMAFTGTLLKASSPAVFKSLTLIYY
ncbi:MAG: CotH kinase family protein [Dysgonamonadaceae bacterium]